MKKQLFIILLLSLTFFSFGFSDICMQCDPNYDRIDFASSSATGRIWYDLTTIFGNGNQVIVRADNPFGRNDMPYFIFYSSYNSKQSFTLEKVTEFGWCTGNENQGHRATLSSSEFILPNNKASLDSMLNYDNVPNSFRIGLTGQYIYRIKIIAPDSGYGSVTRLKYTSNSNYSFGLAWVLHYRNTKNRAGICKQKDICTFGPKDQPIEFVRGKGKPINEIYEWDSCGGLGSITVKSDRISSGYVYLNGEQIFGPSDFYQQVTDLNFDIELINGKNIIEVLLNGKPGSKLEINFLKK